MTTKSRSATDEITNEDMDGLPMEELFDRAKASLEKVPDYHLDRMTTKLRAGRTLYRQIERVCDAIAEKHPDIGDLAKNVNAMAWTMILVYGTAGLRNDLTQLERLDLFVKSKTFFEKWAGIAETENNVAATRRPRLKTVAQAVRRQRKWRTVAYFLIGRTW